MAQKKKAVEGDGICGTNCWLCQSVIKAGQPISKFHGKWRHADCGAPVRAWGRKVADRPSDEYHGLKRDDV